MFIKTKKQKLGLLVIVSVIICVTIGVIGLNHKFNNVPTIQEAYLEDEDNTVNIMSYNIKSGQGMDGKRDIKRAAQVIQEACPDIIGLNEVQYKTTLSGFKDQCEQIAEPLGYNHVFGRSINYKGGGYGNALITKYPILESQVHILPKPRGVKGEERSILKCKLDINGKYVYAMVTHLGLSFEERKEAIIYIEKLVSECEYPVLLLGDFNVESISPEMKPIHNVLEDSAVLVQQDKIRTFNAERPTARIDFIFVSESINVSSANVIDSQASDHLPYVISVEINQ